MVAIVSERNNSNSCERYFYVLLTQNDDVGEESKHTPQHITYVQPFSGKQMDVLEIAEETAKEYDSFDVEHSEPKMFGPDKDTPVITIKPSSLLSAIHVALLDRLINRGIVIPPSQFIRDGYTPHISLKSFHPILDESKAIHVDHIAVMRKYNNIKTVLAKNALGKSNEKATR